LIADARASGLESAEAMRSKVAEEGKAAGKESISYDFCAEKGGGD